MSNPQPNCCLEVDFQKVDQHAGGKWLIHDTKHRKDNQLQSLKLPCYFEKTNLYYRIVVEFLFIVGEDRLAVHIDGSLALIGNVELPISSEFDDSLTTRDLPCRALQCQVDVDGVVLGGTTQGDLAGL